MREFDATVVDGASNRFAAGWRRMSAAIFLVALVLSLPFGSGPPTALAAPKVPSFSFGSSGSDGGQLAQARGLAVNETGAGGVPPGTLYVAELESSRVQSFRPDDKGTPGDPSDDSYAFLATWGWDVIENTEPALPNSNGTQLEVCDATPTPVANASTDCKAGISGPSGGQFSGIAGGLAVHQASGIVSIFDRNNRRVQQFTATGEFLRAWGKDVIQGGGEGFEVCEAAPSCKTGEAGSLAGEFGSNTVALTGIAADAAGNVYVSDPANARVQKFSPTGAFLATGGWNVVGSGANNGAEIQKVVVDAASGDFTLSFGVTAPATTGPIDHDATAAEVQLALEALGDIATGDVRVSGSEGGPWTVRFRANLGNANQPLLSSSGTNLLGDNPALPGAGPSLVVTEVVAGAAALAYEVCEAGTTDICQAGSSGAGTGRFAGGSTGTATPNFIAAGPAGDVYVVGKTNGTIYHLYPSLDFGEEYAETVGTGTATNRNAMAVDPTDGHLFFGQAGVAVGKSTSSIFELDPVSGALVAAHAAGGDQWVGLAVDGSSGRLLGTRTTSAASVQVFEEGLPSLSILPPVANTGTRATLRGTVNPNGVQVVECYFQWGATTAYGNTAPCDPSAVTIGDGTDPVPVQAEIASLVPNGATYHYRLVAVGTKESRSADQSFSTPHTVITTAATSVTDSGATFNGAVNPDTVSLIDCVFEYGTTTAYGQTAPCDPDVAAIGSGTSPVPVHADVSLHPGTIYHFRLRTTYGGGIGPVVGQDLTLQTRGPRILATWSEDVAVNEAFLKAEIDPEGLATTYHFEYGTTEDYGHETADLPVGSDSNPHEVSRFLEGLEPDATYHYRVVATNADAVNEGPDRTFTTFSRIAPSTDCPNQALRRAAAALLPDCRAYEMVSPIDKNGGDIETAEQEAGEGSHYSSAYRQASIHGGKITFSSATAFGDSIGGHWSNQYLATRGHNGWTTHSISSRRGQTLNSFLKWQAYPFFQALTSDLTSAWVRDDNVNPLTGDAVQGFVNLYRRDNSGDSYHAFITQGPFDPNPTPILSHDGEAGDSGGPRVFGFSSDLRHQVFAASAALTPDANQASAGPFGGTNTQLYDLVDGELHLVSVLPNGEASGDHSVAGTASAARLVETRQQMIKNVVSDDGSRIVWSTGGYGPGAIYIRENSGEEQSASGECDEPGKACTRHVAGAVNSSAGAQFWAASADVSKILYSLGSHLNRTLYLFDVEAGTTTEIAGESAGVSAASDDLSHVYFVSSEALGAGAVAGQDNLYNYHAGAYSFVGSLTTDDVTAKGGFLVGSNFWMANIVGIQTSGSPQPILNQTRVTPDGNHFAFMSNSEALSDAAGYDNTDVVTGKPDFHVYRYDAEAKELSCVSCSPSGERPRGSFVEAPYSPLQLTFTNHSDLRVAAWIPTHEHDNYASRILSDDGNRLFFHSDEALLPRDTNGVQDVYQWQAPGVGDCDIGGADYFSQNDGCIYLISSGRDGAKSEFVDATPDGEEIFFSTDESLDPRDPGLRDIYVAKVGGGFPIPQVTAPCEGEACQTPPPPPADPTPASSTFQGLGNAPRGKAPKRCPKGKRKIKMRGGKVRCAKRKSVKRAKKTNHDRRGSR